MIPENEASAFCALIPVLRRRARRLCGCPALADDLVQDTLVRLLQRHATSAPPDNLRAYAVTVLHNLARSHWRARITTEELSEDMATTAPVAQARLELAELHAAITRLPAAQAQLMTLVLAGETSPADLSRLTGQPLGTVMSRLARARSTLRDLTQ